MVENLGELLVFFYESFSDLFTISSTLNAHVFCTKSWRQGKLNYREAAEKTFVRKTRAKTLMKLTPSFFHSLVHCIVPFEQQKVSVSILLS